MKLMDQKPKPIFFIDNLIIDEEFRQITEFVAPGIYPIYYVSNYGKVLNTMTGKVEKIFMRNNGYWYVSVGAYNTYNSRKKFNIHRLVLLTFNYIPGCENLQVNHIDGNKKNNCLTNLEWVTPKQNIEHSIKTGLRTIFGQDKPSAKLRDEDVHNICKLIVNKVPDAAIARDYYPQVSEANINSIHRRHTWKHISQYYNF